MNTYNENLQNTVLASLQSQDLDQKNLNSQYNATKFTLYYAEGATISAAEKLDTAQSDQTFKALIKEQAIHSNNIATNLLSSATQANQYLGQSISNTAVCAANVQIASNAVTRLASDVGSIFSIVNAADFDTDIYNLAREVKKLVDETASDAQFASQQSMDSSTYTSEVSSSTVLDNTKTTTAQMSNIVQIASADYDTSSQVVAADNATLSSASAVEKAAEGTLECLGIDYDSSKAAYKCINEALNMDLRVELTVNQNGSSSPDNATTFTVKFNAIQSPFPIDNPPKGYPVQDYYILVVKESKKLTFGISDAEGIVLNGNDPLQFVKIDHSAIPASGQISQTINYLKFRPKPQQEGGKAQTPQYDAMLDSDKQNVTAGTNYVIFVMAVYTNDYKRKINDFDDFLSAPSQAFCMTDHLAAAQNVSVGLINTEDKDKNDNEKHQNQFRSALTQLLKPNIRMTEAAEPKTGKASEFSLKLTFDVTETISEVAYRCMLLPTADTQRGMLTANSFKSFFAKETVLAQISNTYDPVIVQLQSELADVEMKLQQVAEGDDAQALQGQLDDIKKQIADQQSKKDKALKGTVVDTQSGPGFLFDLTLAEQVSSGNYIPAVPYKAPEDKGQKATGGTSSNTPQSKSYIAYIGPATTDNFGNMLIKGNNYIPVVLSVSTVAEENLSEYTNALSDINATPFTYEG